MSKYSIFIVIFLVSAQMAQAYDYRPLEDGLNLSDHAQYSIVSSITGAVEAVEETSDVVKTASRLDRAAQVLISPFKAVGLGLIDVVNAITSIGKSLKLSTAEAIAKLQTGIADSAKAGFSYLKIAKQKSFGFASRVADNLRSGFIRSITNYSRTPPEGFVRIFAEDGMTFVDVLEDMEEGADQMLQALKKTTDFDVGKGLLKSSEVAEAQIDLASAIMKVGRETGKDIGMIADDLAEVASLSGKGAKNVLAELEEVKSLLRVDDADALKRMRVFLANGGAELSEMAGFEQLRGQWTNSTTTRMLKAMENLSNDPLVDGDMADAIARFKRYAVKDGKFIPGDAENFLSLASRASPDDLVNAVKKIENYGPENRSFLIEYFQDGDIAANLRNPPRDIKFRPAGTLADNYGVWKKTPADLAEEFRLKGYSEPN